MRRQVAQHSPDLEQADPFKGMIQVRHVGAPTRGWSVSEGGRQERSLFFRMETRQQRVRDIVQGIAAEQSVADGTVPAWTLSVYPPTGPERVNHTETIRQFG
jgi:predicted oxidoreductase